MQTLHTKAKLIPITARISPPPEDRKRHLAKGQCKLGVFPRVKITGICWDNSQSSFNSPSSQDVFQYIDQKLEIKKEELRLALHSMSTSKKDTIFVIWNFLHLAVMVLVPMYILVSILLNGWEELWINLGIVFASIVILLSSKSLFLLLDKFNLTPKGLYVVFNRHTGMVEVASESRGKFHHLPFEQFNAHHRTVHSERGAPYYGFTLLHYKEDLMYQIADYVSIEGALVHWELIKNFMDTSEPLADIPQFERYRVYDPTTIAHDKKHGRPASFWGRVDKKFIKKVSEIAHDTVRGFPVKNADTLHEALQHGYQVPDILRFPWREAEHISDELIEAKPNWFYKYVYKPLAI